MLQHPTTRTRLLPSIIGSLVTLLAACGPAVSGGPMAQSKVTFADESISFDDIGYAPSIDRILSPARSHGLKLVNPSTLEVTTVDGRADSATAGGGFLFVLDRSANELRVIDEITLDTVSTAAIGGDYLRYVASENEVWVTQPGDGRIMILALAEDGALTFNSPIASTGGPEGLAVDDDDGVAVAHYFGGDAVIYDASAHDVARSIATGCFGAHGVPALDVARGLAFFGCRDAELVSVRLADGAERGRYRLGGGESLMAFDAASRRAFVRGDPGESIAILDVADDGALTQSGSFTASERGHCLIVAGGALWACDEPGGGLLRFELTE